MSFTVVVALVLALLTVSGLTAAPEAGAAAAATIDMTKTGLGSVLAGSPIPFTLTATNPATVANAVRQYNVSFRDVLPPGVTYKPGSTTPADVGDPTVFTAQVPFPTATSPLVPQQTLVWSNVADLPLGGAVAIGYQVVPPSTLYPVGSTVTNSAQDFASTNPRVVPKFDKTGAPVDGPFISVGVGPPRTWTTSISAITIEKSSDASPEGKLLRGVHDNVSIYTLLVTNNDDDATNGNQVTDYLPANLEFLGCGTTDNTTVGPEYPDAPALGVGRSPTDDCRIPTSVQTVTNPTPALTGVFTKVVWAAPNLAAGDTYTIRYAAAVPLRANTMVFPGGTPSPASGQQGANLDNNTGVSTRQDGDGQAVTNAAGVTGVYQGPTSTDPTGLTGTAVSDDATHTVTAKDVRLLKSVQTNGDEPSKQDEFSVGQIATYTLEVDTSEYASAQGITITDQVPNGVCPLVSQKDWDALVIEHPALADPRFDYEKSCVAAPGQAPIDDRGLPIVYSNVTFDPGTGQFGFQFTPAGTLPPQSTLHITYPTKMLQTYPGGSLAGTATTAGDTFDNTADLTATTTPIGGTSEAGTNRVTDTSSAELVTGGPTIAKLIEPLPITFSTAYSCDGPSSGYADPTNPALPPARTTFALGDLICFELRVAAPSGTYSRNPTVTDFLPAGTSYVSSAIGPGNTLPADQIALDDSGAADGALSWALGHLSGSTRLVDPGETFVVRVAVRVTTPADAGSVDLVGNLMKVQAQNSAGQVRSLRDQVNFSIAPAIPLGITKGVATVNGQPDPENPADTDHQQVQQSDVVDFRVDIANLGTAAMATNRPVSALTVWDVLPAPFRCADVTPAAGLTCRDAGALGDWNPQVGGQQITGKSILRWTVPGPLAAGDTTRFDYTVTVPKIGPSLDVVNTAYISSYVADADDGPGRTVYYPADNIDGNIPVESQLAPAASDPSDLFTAAATATKTITSAIAENGNDGAGQAAVGELLTFKIGARVPAGLTVLNSSLADVLPPTGIELLTAAHPPTAALAPDADDPGATTALPGGFSLNLATGLLTFPATYTNSTDTDQLVILTLTDRFTSAVGGQGDVRTDTARFSYTPVGGSATSTSASANATVVAPLPTLAKSVSPAGPYTGGETITYQLTAGNTAGRPTAYDNWVVDCVPAGLDVTGYLAGSPSTGTAADPLKVTGATGAAAYGCAVGTTRIGWHVGDLAGGVSASLFYTATIDASTAAGHVYTNTANLTASSIPGAVRPTPQSPLPDGARGYGATDTQNITVAVPALVKTANPDHANVGTRVTFTVSAQVPPSVNLYHAVIRDLLPAGLDGSSLTTVSITCTQTPGTCTIPPATATTVPSGTGTLATWDLGDLLSQTSTRTITLTYTALVANVASVTRGATIINGASIAWNDTPGGGQPPFDPTKISTSATVTVTEPVSHLAKSVSNTTPEPGQVYSYTLKYTNGGQAADNNTGPAYNIAVCDAVPAGVVIDPTTLPTGTTLAGTARCAAGRLSWTIPGPIAPGGSVTIAYQAKLAPSTTLGVAAQRNTATVTDVYSQPNSGGRHSTPGNTSSATVTPDFPKVVPLKTAVTTGLAYAGVPFTWKITLTNSGTGRAYNLGALDTLPANWTYDAGSAKVTTANGGPVAVEPTVGAAGAAGPTLTWAGLARLGTAPATDGIAPGQSVVITFDATPGPDAPTAAGTGHPNVNVVTATATDATGATRNSVGPYAAGTGAATALIAAADVQVVKTAGTFTAGDTGSWTLTVTNNGPDTAVGPFQLTDAVPGSLTLPGGGVGAALTFQSAAGAGWSCTTDPDTGDVSCARSNGADSLPAGGSFPPVIITVDVPSGAVVDSTAVNAGQIANRTFDPDLTNNADSATGTVVTEGDLQIRKTVVGTVTAGADANYFLTIANLGPSVSLAGSGRPITVTDTLPAGTQFVSAVGTGGPGWTCPPPVGRALTCTWNLDLPAGANAGPILVTIHVPASTTAAVVNTASVTPGDTPDDDSLNGANSASVSTVPEQQADLGISKVLVDKDNAAPVAGTDREYQLSVTNHGPSDAHGVVITDTLPASVTSNGTFTSVTPGWSCTTAGQVVTCHLSGTLPGPVGSDAGTAVVRISVHISAVHNVADPIVNTATVTADTPDPGPTSNSDTDDSSVTGEADLSIDKTITTAAVAGSVMAYQLSVHNLGPSVATGPTIVSDTLPDGLTYIPGNLPAGSGWTCTVSAANTTLTCSYPDSIGTDVSSLRPAPPIDVPVAVDELALGSVVNQATVSGPVFDPNPDNDTASVSTPIGQLASVSITKAADHSPVVAGTDVSYRLLVVNKGPTAAHLLTVVDTPPEGLVVTGLSGPGWDCVLATLTCTRDLLAVADGTSTITVVGHPEGSVPSGTTLLNAADLSVVTAHPPGTPDWHSEASILVSTLASVSLTKTHDASDDSVSAGDSVNFTLVAANAGPSDAVGPIRIVDTLPVGMSYLSNQGPWDCSVAGQVVTCEFNTDDARIPVGGATPALDLTVSIDSAAPAGDLTNQAVASTGTPQDPDPDLPPPSARDTVQVSTAADLMIEKSHTGTPLAGDTFSWTVKVTNRGPSVSRATAAEPITVTDTLPVGTTFVSGGNADFSCTAGDPGTVICTRTADLAVDAPPTRSTAVSFPVTVAVAPSVRGQLTNNASVTPGLTLEPPGDLAAGNNTATDTVDVDTRADLTITKTHPDGARAVAGTEFSWDIAVANAGPSDSFADAASPIVVTDTLPAGVTFSGANSDDFTCAVGAMSATVVCTATSPLAPGTHGIMLTGLVDADTVGDPDANDPTVHTLTNTVEITASTTPDQAGENTASDTVPLDTRADLAIVKSHQADAVAVPGDQFSWKLQVANIGPSVSRGTLGQPITVTDDLPLGVTLVSATGDGWECVGSGQLVTCTLGSTATPADLPVGEAAPIAIVTAVDVGASGSLTNSATVDPGATTDPDAGDPTGNNASTDTAVPVGPQADLSVTKTHDPALVRIGDPLAFTLTVANHGPSTAQHVTVTDTLPTGLTPTSATAPGWTCAVAAQIVTCLLDGPAGLLPLTAAGGAEQVINVSATVGSAAYPAVVNTVSVSSATPDPRPTNSTADDRVVVPARADLSLSKAVVGKLVVGGRATYRLTVANHGPTPLPTAATVTDRLPASLMAISARGAKVGSGIKCSLGNTVTCTVPGPIGVGGTAVIDLVVQVGPAAYPAVANSGTVTSTTPDPNPDNNSATITSPVTPTVGLTLAKTLQGGGPGPDGLLTWALTVHNAGPNATTAALRVVDHLPAGLVYRGASTPGAGAPWSCTAIATTVTCLFGGTLAGNAETTVLIRTSSAAPAGSTVVNHATLTSGDTVRTADAAYSMPQVLPVGPITSAPPSAPGPPGNAPTPAPPSVPDRTLPNTGIDLSPLLIAAFLLIALGLVVNASTRRRRRS